jgi:RNA polymerase sigma-70 factor (TIGR02943 family)
MPRIHGMTTHTTPENFSVAVAASRTYLLRFARLQLRNDAWAEDVVAETMLAALEKPASFHGKSTLNTWLVGILKYKIIDCIRAHKREIASSINTDEDRELEDLLFIPDGHFKGEPYEWESPEATLNSKQFLAVLDVCIEQMPATMGRVFLMREWMEFSTDEICKELKLSTSNVWVLLHRARLRLRECLQIKWFGGNAVSDIGGAALKAE